MLPAWVARAASRVGFTLLSVGLFCALWELLWALGISDARLLPPPHVFLSNFPEQAKFFNTAQRWQVGVAVASLVFSIGFTVWLMGREDGQMFYRLRWELAQRRKRREYEAEFVKSRNLMLFQAWELLCGASTSQ